MSFQDAYERILQSTGLRTQTDVAALLGVKQSSISDAKRRNHIPDSWIDLWGDSPQASGRPPQESPVAGNAPAIGSP